PDGSKVFVTGESGSGGGVTDAETIAYDTSTGTALWKQRYDGPASGSDDGVALQVSPDGTRVFVTGDSEGVGSGDDYVTVAYDTVTGHQGWAARYDGPASGFDAADGVD